MKCGSGRKAWSFVCRVALYVGVFVLFGGTVARFWYSGTRLNYLVAFGDKLHLAPVPEMLPLNRLVERDGYGYDGQFYAQIAMRPLLQGADLAGATDGLAYRARRILPSWTAFALGLGRPSYILQAYAVQNVLAWVMLAILLLHWFPPTDLSNWFRWSTVLFAAGMCQTVRLALVDGPALLLICAGLFCIDKNRRTLAIVPLGLAGLARETGLLCCGALLESQSGLRPTRRFLVSCAAVCAPLLLWLGFIWWKLGAGVDAGASNLGFPFLAYFARLGSALHDCAAAAVQERVLAGATLLVLVSIGVQCAFMVTRWRPAEAWWRVGVGYCVLLALLGMPVWQGMPGAAPRVLLPLQVAFNVLVPKARRWWPVLLLGNLGVLAAPVLLPPPSHPGYGLSGNWAVFTNAEGTADLRVAFSDEWLPTETSKSRYWRWSRGNADVTIYNPHDRVMTLSFSAILQAVDRRTVTISTAGKVLGRHAITPGADLVVRLPDIPVPPGSIRLRFESDAAPKQFGPSVSDGVAFGVANLRLTVR